MNKRDRLKKFICATQILGQIFLYVPMSFAGSESPNTTKPIFGQEQTDYGNNAFDNSSTENNVARIAENIASNNKEMSSYALSSATNYATSSFQKWLSQFGTAQVKFGIDQDYHLSESSIDTLFSLYDTQDLLFFSQLGYRHKDSRNTANIGFGGRYFMPTSMLGTNVFYDNDFTGHNRRLGAGIEYWRDYLKLGANGYFRLTDWHQSRDFEDYDERPANGFDVRAEGYLPGAPQLGAKVTYEQYYGNDVALFGRSSREKDPKAITLGLNYTPVPLVTMGVDFRDSQKGGNNDTILGLEFNYDFGVPFSEQIDPSKVSLRRTLAGSRMDLVQRNNDIVLEYRKQDLLNARLPDQIKGLESTRQPVRLTIKSKYGVSDVQWSGSVLTQPGVQLAPMAKGSHTDWTLSLPPYVEKSLNQYTLTAVVHDIHGNAAPATSTNVIVEQNPGNLVKDSMTCAPATVVISSDSKSVCSVRVDNGQGQPLANAKVNWKTDIGSLSAENSTSDASGVATVTLRNNQVSVSTVTAAISESAASAQVAFVAGAISASQSSLTATPVTVKASGSDVSKIVLTARDESGNPIDDLTVAFATAGVPVTLSGVTSNGNGIYTADLTGTVAGDVSITPTINGSEVNALKASVKLVAGDIDQQQSSLKAVPATIQADGKTTSVVTLTAVDANKNPIAGQQFTFSKVSGPEGTLGTVTEKAPGQYEALFTAGTQPGTVTVGASGPSGDTNLRATITLTQMAVSPTNSTLAVDPSEIEANGTSTAVITFKARSESNLPLGGLNVTFSSDNAVPVTIASVQETESGTYTAILTSGTRAGVVNISAAVDGSTVGSPVPVTLTAGKIDPAHSALTVSPAQIAADGVASSLITFTAKDANDNPLDGLPIAFSPTGVAVTLSAVNAKGNGEYTATLTGLTPGSVDIRATNGGSDTGVAPQTVTLVTTGVDAGTSTLVANPTTIVADGKTQSTLTFTAMDKSSHPLSGLNVTFDYSGVAVQSSAVTEKGNGVYTATLSGTVVGDAIISASVDGTSAVNTPAKVTLTSAYKFLDGKMTVTKDNAEANGTDDNDVSVTVVDQAGNPTAGQVVTFAADNGAVLKSTTVTTDTSGVAVNTLTSTVDGSSNVTATLADSASTVVDTVTASVTFKKAIPLTFKTVKINGFDFEASTGVPTTGFTGGEFQLIVDSTLAATDFDWATDRGDLISVDGSGNVKLNKEFPAGTGAVTITATEKDNPAKVATYRFTINRWFIHGEDKIPLAQAINWCSEQGYEQSSLATLSNAPSSKASKRGPGRFWPEWGDMTAFGWSVSPADYWATPVIAYQVDMYNLAGGMAWRVLSTEKYTAACERKL